MSTVNGKTVTVVRKAKEGDAGYDKAKDQTFIRDEYGNEKVVDTATIKD